MLYLQIINYYIIDSSHDLLISHIRSLAGFRKELAAFDLDRVYGVKGSDSKC